MAERKVKVKVTPDGPEVDALEVDVLESLERWSELRLNDGAVLNVKPIITSVARVPGRYDPEGNPLYVIKGGFALAVKSIPPDLRQPK